MRFLLLIIIPTLSFAQNFLPELGKEEITMCMTQSMNMDPLCQCRATKSCYGVVNDQNREAITKYAQEKTKEIGPEYAYVFKQSMEAEQLVSGIFSGKTDINKIDINRLEEMNKKFEQLQNKVFAAAQKSLAQQTGQQVDFHQLGKKQNENSLNDILSPEQRKELEVMPLGALSSSVDDLIPALSDANPLIANAAPQVDMDQSLPSDSSRFNAEESQSVAETKEEPKVEEPSEKGIGSDRSISSEEIDSALAKKYNFNDINKNSDLSIFDLISARYLKKKPDLE